MSKKTVCDRCGKNITDQTDQWRIDVMWEDFKRDDDKNDIDHRYDYCSDCGPKVYNLIKKQKL